jgi:hypothetical protein
VNLQLCPGTRRGRGAMLFLGVVDDASVSSYNLEHYSARKRTIGSSSVLTLVSPQRSEQCLLVHARRPPTCAVDLRPARGVRYEEWTWSSWGGTTRLFAFAIGESMSLGGITILWKLTYAAIWDSVRFCCGLLQSRECHHALIPRCPPQRHR